MTEPSSRGRGWRCLNCSIEPPIAATRPRLRLRFSARLYLTVTSTAMTEDPRCLRFSPDTAIRNRSVPRREGAW